MDLANQVMFGLGELLDALCHVMQFFQHRVLTGGNAVHPPKADEPTANADPSEGDHDHPRSYIASSSRFSNREGIDALRHEKRSKMKMSILWRASRFNLDIDRDFLTDPGNGLSGLAKHQVKLAPFEGLGCDLPARMLHLA